jgi:hypothetical protein
LGLLEMPQWQIQKDAEAWDGLVNWLCAPKQQTEKAPQGPLRVGLGGAVRLAFSRGSN